MPPQLPTAEQFGAMTRDQQKALLQSVGALPPDASSGASAATPMQPQQPGALGALFKAGLPLATKYGIKEGISALTPGAAPAASGADAGEAANAAWNAGADASTLNAATSALPWANGSLGALGGAGVVTGGVLAGKMLGDGMTRLLNHFGIGGNFTNRPYDPKIDANPLKTQLGNASMSDADFNKVLQQADAEHNLFIPQVDKRTPNAAPVAASFTPWEANFREMQAKHPDIYNEYTDRLHGAGINYNSDDTYASKLGKAPGATFQTNATQNPYALTADELQKLYGIKFPTPAPVNTSLSNNPLATQLAGSAFQSLGLR